MTFRQVVRVIVIGVGFFLSAAVINAMPYRGLSWSYIAQLAVGPLAILLLIPREFWPRAFVGLLAFAGVFGFAIIGGDYGEAWLNSEPLPHASATYILHGLISGIFLLVYVGWTALDRRRSE